MNPAFAIAEIIWIVRGRSDAAFLTRWNRGLSKFVGEGDLLHGAYGRRLREHFGIDQLTRAAKVLQANPESRQVVLEIWDSRIDLPGADGMPTSGDIPCNVSSLVKVREGKLEWTQVMRSNDVFRGLPYNLIQFTALQEILAGWMGLDVGTYAQWSDSLHLYVRDEDAQYELLREPTGLTEDLRLDKAASEKAFRTLEVFCDELWDVNLDGKRLSVLVSALALPTPYKNLAYVLAAEAARRRGLMDACEQSIGLCSNPDLKVLIRRWTDERLLIGAT